MLLTRLSLEAESSVEIGIIDEILDRIEVCCTALGIALLNILLRAASAFAPRDVIRSLYEAM